MHVLPIRLVITHLAESYQYAFITEMQDIIQAIVIDGFHKGHVLQMRYHPVIKLLRPTIVMVDTGCGELRCLPPPQGLSNTRSVFDQ